MKSTALMACGLFVIASARALAAPVEFDTPDAHVIVVRPVDRWSGDSQAQANSLKGVSQRNVAYFVVGPDGTSLRGFDLTFQRASDHVLIRRTNEVVRSMGGEPGRSQNYLVHVREAIALPPDRYAALAAAESEAWRQQVLSQGDPETLQSRVSGRKVAAGLLTAVVTVGTGNALGANAAGGLLQSGLSSDVYEVASRMKQAFAPGDLPPLASPETFRAIDVRRVAYAADMNGQIVIAYRADKTSGNEEEALARAIATVAGLDTTVEVVQRSRDLDFTRRRELWAACVANEACAAEPSPPRTSHEQ